MNCIKCYQEIPEGSKFCPHCGAEQPDTASAGNTAAQPDAAASQDTAAQQDQNTQYQDSYAQYQNTYTSDYQNTQYQTPPVYQSSYEPEKPINWVPYLVLSIISTLCCCIPFGIVAIVFSAKINSAVTAGNIEEAKKAAKTAKIWIIAAVAAGLLASIAYLVISALIGTGSYYYYY